MHGHRADRVPARKHHRAHDDGDTAAEPGAIDDTARLEQRKYDQYDDDRFGARPQRQYGFEHSVFDHNRFVYGSRQEQVEDRNDDDDEGKELELTPAPCRGSKWKLRGGKPVARRA
jgi:hypothetical protein